MDETKPLDDLAVWNYIRPLFRKLKPTSVETTFWNGGDIVETRADFRPLPHITESFQLKPDVRGLSCPSVYEELSVSVFPPGVQLRFRTKGSATKEAGWLTHRDALLELVPKAIYMAEESAVRRFIRDVTEEIQTLRKIKTAAEEAVRGK